MFPPTYYNWLSDRNWAWFGFSRLRPGPDQRYPLLALILFPCLTAGVVVAVLVGLSQAARLNSDSPGPGIPSFLIWALGIVAFTGSLVHRTFACLSWNQRAARLKTTGQPSSMTRTRPGALVRWLLGPFYVLIIALVTPLALLTAVENVRGAVKWQSVRNDLVAQGEKLNIRELIAEPGPAEQNFFGSAPFNQLILDTGTANRVNTNALAEFRVFELPRTITSQRAPGDRRHQSLAEWAVSFRVAISNQSLASGTKGYQSRQPPLSVPPTNATDADVVLIAMEKSEPLLRSICEATHRPQAVFAAHWEDGFNTLLPHLTHMKALQQLLDVRVAALLAKNESNQAFAEVECALRLAQILQHEPLIISQLVHIAQAHIAAQSVWRGLADHAWDDDQLTTLQQQLSTNDYVGNLVSSFEGERAMGLAYWDRLANNRRLFWASSYALGEVDPENPDGGAISLMPVGWIRQNQANLARMYQDLIGTARLLATNPAAGGYGNMLKEFGQREDANLQKEHRNPSPYNLSSMLMPAVEKAVGKAVRAEATDRCAATGCALERYRLKFGNYPETLEALVPAYLKNVPLDPINHEPLHYSRTDDALFRLWSVGLNGQDDGGVFRRKKQNEAEDLDWPWPY